MGIGNQDMSSRDTDPRELEPCDDLLIRISLQRLASYNQNAWGGREGEEKKKKKGKTCTTKTNSAVGMPAASEGTTASRLYLLTILSPGPRQGHSFVPSFEVTDGDGWGDGYNDRSPVSSRCLDRNTIRLRGGGPIL